MVPNATTHDQDEPWYDWGYSKGPLNKAVLMDWIDQGLDFFGCDENTPKKMFGDSLRLRSAEAKVIDLHTLDYAKLHDEFLEALLFEQTQKPAPTKDELDVAAANLSLSQSSSNSIYTSASASASASSFATSNLDGDSSSMSTKARKRPRPLRLHRKVMPTFSNSNNDGDKKKDRTVSPNALLQQSIKKPTLGKSNNNSIKSSNKISAESVPVSLDDLSRSHFPPPYVYIHPHCRMQKDKGKGEPVGSNICAKGREACLEKLQQKMELLTRVAFGEEKKGSADMKRRPAKVSEIFPNFTETRSIIELRMGFLSMQYGILLRWDTSKTGKVALVVLRKMCHDKFYERSVVNPKKQRSNFYRPPTEPVSNALCNVIDGNHAILHRPDGMEVALLEPPYRVARPDVFPPTLLSISLLYVSGLARKSNWTVQICYDGKSENILLGWDNAQGCFVPKTDMSLKREIPQSTSLELYALEIYLLEHKIRRKSKRRCIATMNVPLNNLEAHPTSRKATPSEMKIPCTHDPESVVTLSVLLESDYANWLRSEVEARRREEVNNLIWKAPFRVSDASFRVLDPVYDEEEDDTESVWEWICSAC